MVSLKEQKAISSLLILIIVLATVVGAVAIYLWVSPGELITEEIEYTDFTAVNISPAFKVEIKQSSSYSIIIKADEQNFDNIKVTKTGNTLTIGIEPAINVSNPTLILPYYSRGIDRHRQTMTGLNSKEIRKLGRIPTLALGIMV